VSEKIDVPLPEAELVLLAESIAKIASSSSAATYRMSFLLS